MESRFDEEPDERCDPGCPICKGVAFVHPLVNGKIDYSHTMRCRCRKAEDEAERQQRYRKFCQLPEGTRDLSQFRLGTGKKYECLQEALELSGQIAEGTGELRWLVFMGDVDRGKSYLAKAICKRWLERGESARYSVVPELLIELREGFKKGGEQSYYSLKEFFCKVSLLVLDDLGMEYHKKNDEGTDWAMEQLETIINNRYENDRYLIVTTNKSFDELSPRIASRLQRYPRCRIMVLDSPEYRLWRKNGSLH